MSTPAGYYAGTWASNADFGDGENLPTYEIDAYLGFGGKIAEDLGYDLKLGYYAYPDGRNSDFSEVEASLTWNWLTAGVAYNLYGQADEAPDVVEGEALYIQVISTISSVSTSSSHTSWARALRSGYSDFRYNDGGNDYANWGLTLSREAGDFGTFSLNYDQVGRDTYDDDPKVWVGWLKKF
ncbi:MAG: TorF family putative porin [Chromatiales bacterium]|nr:TorF family putative porin [Chromatiales bacterium]